MKGWIVDALQYKQWAESRIIEAVETLPTDGRTMAFARQQLGHMVIVEELFRSRLCGASPPHTATNVPDPAPLPVLSGRLRASTRWYLDYAASLSVDALETTVAFCFADGLPGSMRREEILFHIVNHGTYHRGAIGHALDLAGAARPADTYTVFIHAAQPQRRAVTLR